MTHPNLARAVASVGAAALVMATATACSASPLPSTSATATPGSTTAAAPTATTTARTPAVALQQLAVQYRGLPVRIRVSGPANAKVRITRGNTRGRVLARGRTDGTGATTLTWTWRRAGSKRIVARIGSRSVTKRVTVHNPNPPLTPPSATLTKQARFTAGGQSQYLDCAGQGGPTVVLVSGTWGTSADWDNQFAALREGGRVCRYDRPGLGNSSDRVGTLDLDSGVHADELFQLLTVAGERGPFELVGHSYGGMIVQSFAAKFPRETAGMVLLDPVPLNLSRTMSELGSSLDEATPRTTMDLARSSQSGQAADPLVGLPLILVSAGVAPSWLSWSGFQAWRDGQQEQVQGCANCLHWVAEGATHQLQDTAPDLTLSAIETVRTSLRTHRPL